MHCIHYLCRNRIANCNQNILCLARINFQHEQNYKKNTVFPVMDLKHLFRFYAGVYSFTAVVNLFCCVTMVRRKSRAKFYRLKLLVFFIGLADIISTVKDLPSFFSSFGPDEEQSSISMFFAAKANRTHLLFIIASFIVLLTLLRITLEEESDYGHAENKATLAIDLLVTVVTGINLVFCWNKYKSLSRLPMDQGASIGTVDVATAATNAWKMWPDNVAYLMIGLLVFVYVFSYYRLSRSKDGNLSNYQDGDIKLIRAITVFFAVFVFALVFEILAIKGYFHNNIILLLTSLSLPLLLLSLLPVVFVFVEYSITRSRYSDVEATFINGKA